MAINVKWVALLPLSISPVLQAEVIIDGSLGGGVQQLSGPIYNIHEGLGQRQGTNLFHSFSQFNIASGEQARFSTSAPTQNILARVTGGDVSTIDGIISSDRAANLWLMNPAGWIVGENAQLNVQGSFHLTTANTIGLANGGMFFADPTSHSVLSTAAPIDYQFNAGSSAKITLDRADLIMPEGNSITLVGGDIQMTNASISAPGGRILLASNSGQGKWDVNAAGLTQSSGSGGTINIEHDGLAALHSPSLTTSDVSAESNISAGTLQIIAGQINLKNASIVNHTGDKRHSGNTTLRADQIKFNASFIDNNVRGSKNAGSIHILGHDLLMENGSIIRSDTGEETTGHGGDINVNLMGQLYLSGQSGISSNIQGNRGGDINLKSNSLVLVDKSSIRAATLGDAHAGNISINTGQLSLKNKATLSTATLFGKGNAGNITINADSVGLSQGSEITSSSFEEGNSGNIDLLANNLALEGSKIQAKSEGLGTTGRVNLNISENIKLQQGSKINTLALQTDGGEIHIESNGLAVQQSQIVTSVEGLKGNGGDILVNTNTLVMSGGFIQANTAAAGAKGGDIQVNATNTLASQGRVLVGGDVRQQYSPSSTLNVIQAAAPDGVSGQVNLSTVELNIAGQLAKVESDFVPKKAIGDNPCNVARNEKMSSLIQIGQGALPVKASDYINLPLYRHLPENGVAPQSHYDAEGQQLAFLSASNLCKQELN